MKLYVRMKMIFVWICSMFIFPKCDKILPDDISKARRRFIVKGNDLSQAITNLVCNIDSDSLMLVYRRDWNLVVSRGDLAAGQKRACTGKLDVTHLLL